MTSAHSWGAVEIREGVADYKSDSKLTNTTTMLSAAFIYVLIITWIVDSKI